MKRSYHSGRDRDDRPKQPRRTPERPSPSSSSSSSSSSLSASSASSSSSSSASASADPAATARAEKGEKTIPLATDATFQTRNRRMFSGLLAHIKVDVGENESDKKRKALEERVVAKISEEQRKISVVLAGAKRQATQDRINAINEGRYAAVRERYEKNVRNFITTTAEPHLKWLPAVHNGATSRLLETETQQARPLEHGKGDDESEALGKMTVTMEVAGEAEKELAAVENEGVGVEVRLVKDASEDEEERRK